jgi:hypothetical protein
MKTHKIVNTGTIAIEAITRGVTNFLIGSVLWARIASICSLTNIVELCGDTGANSPSHDHRC